jgi:hypothetical protein
MTVRAARGPLATTPEAGANALAARAGEGDWVRLRVEVHESCQAPLLVIASLMARRALEVRSASLVPAPEGGGMLFEATVRGSGQRVRSVARSLDARMGVLDVRVLAPTDDEAAAGAAPEAPS